MSLRHWSALILFMSLSGCSSNSVLGNKERAYLHLEIASAALQEGDPTQALIALKEAHEADDSIPETQYLYSLAYFQKGELVLATQAAEKANELRKDYTAAKNTLGKLYFDQGRYAEAEKLLTEASKDLTFRDSYLPKTNLGILYYKTLKDQKAEYWLTQAIKDGKSNACLAYYYRGQIHYQKGDYPKALVDLNESTQASCAGFAESRLAIGKTLVRLKKYDQARIKLLELKQLFPTSDAADQANELLREVP